jgi:glycosyltransferase involved in cell wall biosynthesis
MLLRDNYVDGEKETDLSQILVSVVMAVYNGIPYINLSLNSLLHQTHKNLEIIIVDDCSIDGTNRVLKSYQNQDPRILIIRNEENKGAAISRNIGIGVAKGNYIAIADADDIYYSNRIMKQLQFLDSNRDYQIVFGNKKIIDQNNWLKAGTRTRTDCNYNDTLKISLLFKNEFLPNPLAFFDSKIKNEFIYDDGFPPVEDYKLWIELIDKYKFYVLQEILMYYREHQKGISKRNLDAKKELELKVTQKALLKLNIDADQNELEMHYSLSRAKVNKKIIDQKSLVSWIEKLKISNSWSNYSSSYHFNRYVDKLVLNFCIKGFIRAKFFPTLTRYLVDSCSSRFLILQSINFICSELNKRMYLIYYSVLKRKVNSIS